MERVCSLLEFLAQMSQLELTQTWVRGTKPHVFCSSNDPATHLGRVVTLHVQETKNSCFLLLSPPSLLATPDDATGWRELPNNVPG